MYIYLLRLLFLNCLCTIPWTTTTLTTSNDRIVRNLRRIVDTALQTETSDDVNNEDLIKQLSAILEEEDGFRIVDRPIRSVNEQDQQRIYDGSGDDLPDDLPPFYTNMSIITFTMGTTETSITRYTPPTYPPCRCEKGDRGDKGDAGVCPVDCDARYESYTKDCVGSRINVERLAQSIRQLIIDTKKIAYRNAQKIPCTCVASPSSATMTTQLSPDYSVYTRVKGEKGDRGDPGTSCSPACMQQSTQGNIRVFQTLQEAMDASYTYPDHTYVHIVDAFGRLQSVYIRVYGQLIPIRLENENSLTIQVQVHTLPPTTIYVPKPMVVDPKPRCAITLACPRLHLFALGPHVRKMCNPKRANSFCSKLSDYDGLCTRVSERHRLKGFYRAFMSTSTQWLSNLFAGICVNAKVVNMHEQTLFDAVEDMFLQKPPQSELLDVQGLRPQFQYWWHGSFVNGTASSDTCLDWSRQDTNLSGIASRIPDGVNGLFHYQYTWPCSIGDSNMGILCIETNCNKKNYYKH